MVDDVAEADVAACLDKVFCYGFSIDISSFSPSRKVDDGKWVLQIRHVKQGNLEILIL